MTGEPDTALAVLVVTMLACGRGVWPWVGGPAVLVAVAAVLLLRWGCGRGG